MKGILTNALACFALAALILFVCKYQPLFDNINTNPATARGAHLAAFKSLMISTQFTYSQLSDYILDRNHQRPTSGPMLHPVTCCYSLLPCVTWWAPGYDPEGWQPPAFTLNQPDPAQVSQRSGCEVSTELHQASGLPLWARIRRRRGGFDSNKKVGGGVAL